MHFIIIWIIALELTLTDEDWLKLKGEPARLHLLQKKLKYKGSTGSTWYYRGMQGSTGSTWYYRGMQGSTGSTWYYRGMQGSTGEVQGEYVGVRREYVGVRREYKGSTMGVQGAYEVRKSHFSPLLKLQSKLV